MANKHLVLCGGTRLTSKNKEWRDAPAVRLQLGTGKKHLHLKIHHITRKLASQIPDAAVEFTWEPGLPGRKLIFPGRAADEAHRERRIAGPDSSDAIAANFEAVMVTGPSKTVVVLAGEDEEAADGLAADFSERRVAHARAGRRPGSCGRRRLGGGPGPPAIREIGIRFDYGRWPAAPVRRGRRAKARTSVSATRCCRPTICRVRNRPSARNCKTRRGDTLRISAASAIEISV